MAWRRKCGAVLTVILACVLLVVVTAVLHYEALRPLNAGRTACC